MRLTVRDLDLDFWSLVGEVVFALFPENKLGFRGGDTFKQVGWGFLSDFYGSF